MLTAYIFCLVLGGGLLALSFFGDFLEGEVDAAIDLDADVDSGLDAGDFARLFSLRAIVYALFGFGAAGAVLYAIWGGARPGLTAALAGGMGLASGALISAVFGYLKRSESVDEAAVTAAASEARAQLERYLAEERLARQFPGVGFIGLVLVFHGWEVVYRDAVRR